MLYNKNKILFREEILHEYEALQEQARHQQKLNTAPAGVTVAIVRRREAGDAASTHAGGQRTAAV